MSEIPEVFAIFEQKLAHVLSFTVVPLKSKDLKNALEEILTYFSSIVERASKAESRIAELEMKIRHNALWQASKDAEERAHLEKLVLDLKKRIAELEGENKKAFDFVKTLRTYCIYAHWDNPDTEGEFNEFDAEICKWLSEFTERER